MIFFFSKELLLLLLSKNVPQTLVISTYFIKCFYLKNKTLPYVSPVIHFLLYICKLQPGPEISVSWVALHSPN